MRDFFRKLLGTGSPPEAEEAAEAPEAARPAFVPANTLEQLLVAAATDPERRPAFQQALLAADLYAATPEPAPEGVRELEAGDQVSLLNVPGRDGAPVAALFSSEGRIIEAFGPGTGFLLVGARQLLDLVSGTGAFLNPGSDYGVEWSPADLCALLGKPVRWTVEEPTEIMLGTPSDPPEALLGLLRDRLGGDSRISEAWFAAAWWPGRNERSWYLDVRTDLDADAINASLADAFSAATLAGQTLNMIVRPPGGEPGMGIRLVPSSTH
jgi:SseB protein N-terminal domain